MTSSSDEKDNLNRKRGISANEESEYIAVPTADIDNDRAEKPWQRVPCTLLILLLGVYLLLGYLTQLVEDKMPSVVREAEVARDNSEVFSEEAAWRYLRVIIGDEPRVAGTPYHYEKTIDMKGLVDGIAAQATQTVRTDWQFATGDYYLWSAAPFVNYYQNASNIIALLEGESGFHSNGNIGSSILLNCHYDSVPYALGASDNVVFCAIMAETLNKLSRRTTKLKHNIIFLFNGAEENPLQASHAFLQHPWARGVTTVVNLDAAGMNGKPAIFQVTDPRVLNAYCRTARDPNAQGLGEFLFSSGIIPSDTDFRIWRDFGDIHGVDIAFTKWGHVYHTRYDMPDLIHTGVMQGAGNMLLALTNEIGDMAELGERQANPSAAVYFDYLNVFVLTYSLSAAYAIDFFMAIFALSTVGYYVWLVDFRVSTMKELLFSALGRLASMLAGIIATAILVLIMVATTTQMRYLTQPWIVVPIFWMPYLITAVGVSQLYDAWRLKKNGFNRSVRTLQAMAATRLILAAVLLVMTCVPALTTMRYLITAPLFMISQAAIMSLTVHKYFRLTGWQHLLLEVCLSVPTAMFMFTLALRVDAMMLPIMGRSASAHPDYTVAILNVGLAIIVSSTVSGLELLFSRQRLWMVLSALGVATIVIMFVPFSPYSDDGPSVQRHMWFHSEIVSFDINNNTIQRTSGLLVTKHDPYSLSRVRSALSAAGINVNIRTDFADDCDSYVHCNLPLFRTSFARNLGKAMFINMGPPAAFDPPPTFTAVSRSCAGELCTYNFVMTGANHNMITLWPRSNVTVTAWSLLSEAEPSFYQQDRPVYVIFHSTATYSEAPWSFDFSVTFRVPASLQSQPVLDVSHHSHKIYHPQEFTSEYRAILDVMPKYFNVATFISRRYNYVI